jgi:hypothetical protein
MSDNPTNNNQAPVVDSSLKADNVNTPDIKQEKQPRPLRRAVKTWLDMLVASTSRKS